MTELKTRDIGQQAEQLACEYLQNRGLRLRSRNYHCKHGEIDLIMEDKGYLVFVEVRKRKHAQYGTGNESIVMQKRSRIIRSAKHYLQKHKLYYRMPCRFDTVGLDQQSNVAWIPNAFEAN